MWRALISTMLLLVLTASAFSQNRQTEPARKELEDLDATYKKAQGEFSKLLYDARTLEEAERIRIQQSIAEKRRVLVADLVVRANSILEKYPNENEVVVETLIWIIDRAPGESLYPKAVDLLIRDHLPNPKIDALLLRHIHQYDAANENLFRAVVEKADTTERRGKARLALAQLLISKSEAIRRIERFNDHERQTAELVLGKDLLALLSTTNPSELTGEAERLLVGIVKDAGEVESLRTIQETAESELFEIRYLAIGKQAPEIEGEDIDGNKFKLSDYRGKVVVLDFWGFW